MERKKVKRKIEQIKEKKKCFSSKRLNRRKGNKTKIWKQNQIFGIFHCPKACVALECLTRKLAFVHTVSISLLCFLDRTMFYTLNRINIQRNSLVRSQRHWKTMRRPCAHVCCVCVYVSAQLGIQKSNIMAKSKSCNIHESVPRENGIPYFMNNIYCTSESKQNGHEMNVDFALLCFCPTELKYAKIFVKMMDR